MTELSEKSEILLRTKVYRDFLLWITKSVDEPLWNTLQSAEGDYRDQIIKIIRKLDFFRTFIIISELSFQNISQREERFRYIYDIVGSVIGRLVYETTDIVELNSILFDLNARYPTELSAWFGNRRMGGIWIKDTFVEKFIEKYLKEIHELEDGIGKNHNELDFNLDRIDFNVIDYAKCEFALSSGTSYMDVESILARGVSRTSLCNILYGFILVRRLIDSLENNLILTGYEDGELFRGNSGINHYFDGIFSTEDIKDKWLLRCVSGTHNPLAAIESIDSKLDDIGMKKCIVFMPMYPSQNALKYSVYTYSENHHEIMILYLSDLYNIIKLENKYIKKYIVNKMIGEFQ